MAALGWLPVSGGRRRRRRRRRREMILTDANLFLRPCPWCVSIGSRGPGISPAALGLPPLPSAPLLTRCCWGRCWHQTLVQPLKHCQASLCVSSWPSQDWELTSADRRLSPPPWEVTTAFNAVARGEGGGGERERGNSHLCHVYGAQAHQWGIIIAAIWLRDK